MQVYKLLELESYSIHGKDSSNKQKEVQIIW